MEQRQIDFKAQPQTKRGDIGEGVVDRHFMAMGVTVYAPQNDGPHPFDRLCIRPDLSQFIVEIKTKPRRKYYPDTGVDYRHYETYKAAEARGLAVYLYFVDAEIDRAVYGNLLSILDRPRQVEHNGGTISYPLRQTTKRSDLIYFPRRAMHTLCALDKADCAAIKRLSTRNPLYN